MAEGLRRMMPGNRLLDGFGKIPVRCQRQPSDHMVGAEDGALGIEQTTVDAGAPGDHGRVFARKAADQHQPADVVQQACREGEILVQLQVPFRLIRCIG